MEMFCRKKALPPIGPSLNPKEPSLKETLAGTGAVPIRRYRTEKNPLSPFLGASELFGVRLSADKSEQEKFLFLPASGPAKLCDSLSFRVVLWLSDPLATRVALRQAEDFWSWRSGGVLSLRQNLCQGKLCQCSILRR